MDMGKTKKRKAFFYLSATLCGMWDLSFLPWGSNPHPCGGSTES